MKVTELESKGLKKSYKIVVDASRINDQIEVELKAAGERVKIPGFRPGHIPMKTLKQRYGKSVQADVLKQVISDTTTEVLKDKKVRPAMTPQINIESYQDEGDLTYTMSTESFPDVPEIKLDNIKVTRKTFDVGESDIDKAAERVAERSPTFERAKEGSKAALGNVVAIDFKGSIDGVAFDGGSASNFRLELGSGQFIEGFEDQLVGAKEGDDKTVKVTFPKDYPGDKLAGKEASFAVKVREIHNKSNAVLDDDFAKERGFADLRALREAIRNQLIKEYDQIVRNQVKKELFDVLEERFTFTLPQGMVEAEFNTIWERLQQAKAQGDESVADKSDDELKKEYEQIAKRRVKLGILLAEIGNRQKIQVSREEMSRAVMQQASQFPGQEKKVMEFYQKNPDRVEDLRGPILEEKAVDYILSKISFNDEKTSLEDLAGGEDEDDDSAKSTKKSSGSKPKSAKKK